jgi:hypothetical protein
VRFPGRQAAKGSADPTGTCSQRSATPEGAAPDTTSSGLPSSLLRGDLRGALPTGLAVARRPSRGCVRPKTSAAAWRPEGRARFQGGTRPTRLNLSSCSRCARGQSRWCPLSVKTCGDSLHPLSVDLHGPKTIPCPRTRGPRLPRAVGESTGDTFGSLLEVDRSRPVAVRRRASSVSVPPTRAGHLRIAPEDAELLQSAG